jgi:hypothetical protein
MAKIYRTTDKIPLKIGELTVNVSPLSFEQKMTIQTEILKGGAQAAMRAAKMACQCAVKSIDGLEGTDGNPYSPEMVDNKITDSAWDDLQNIQETQSLIAVCLSLINGIPKEFVDPNTGKKLEGVSLIVEETKGKKK